MMEAVIAVIAAFMIGIIFGVTSLMVTLFCMSHFVE